MKAALFDTNILIDAISAITLIELYAGVALKDKPEIASVLTRVGFDVIQIDANIINIAARIRSASVRRRAKIALPDAIILATAQARGLVIVTRNKKDFKGPNVRVPYELEIISSTRVINVRPPPLP